MNSVSDQDPAPLVTATGISDAGNDAASEAFHPSENFSIGDETTQTHGSPEESARPISRMEQALSGTVGISFENPRSFLNYAMADSGIGLFESVTVKNEGELKSKVYVCVEATINDDVVVGRAESQRFDLDMDSREQFTSRDLSFLLKPDLLSQVEWSAHGRLTAAVVFNGKVVALESFQITVLEARQWVQCESVVDLPPDYKGPPPPVDMSSMALLAAFTQYQSPAIKDLVEAAQPFLNQIDAFVGYQADEPTIVDAQVRAIAEAMRQKGIAYHNPEPGWIYAKGAGQTIRTPEDVLIGREGTCLDTSVVLAAALERVDIRPLIFVIKGHAFLSYWRQEGGLPQSFFTDKGVVQHLLQSGLLGFVETTKLTQGNESLSLDQIQEEPLESRLKANLSNFEGIIDVSAARRLDGISPLPVRAEINGEIQIIVAGENQAGHAREHIIRIEREDEATDTRQETPPRVQFWKNALLDLSLRNALINFKDIRGASLHIPGQDLGKFEDILNAEQVLELLPSDALSETAKKQGVSDAKDLPDHVQSEILFGHSKIFSNLDAARYETALTRMQHRARTYRQETGANNLYVAVGILEWPFSPTNSRFGGAGVKTLRSPLILVPVKLERPGKSSTFRLSLDPTGESTPNFSLLEKLRRELDIELPDIWTPTTDQSGIDVEKTFKNLQAALYAKNLSNFHVEPTAHLGIFQFSKFRLWKDLNDHWEEFVQNPVVGHLALKSHEVFEDPVEIPAETDYDSLLKDCPLPADGSQLRAIGHAVHGRSFVLEGPPGTGKSQTIANMLARAIVSGKKVLFVAEKSQALSVVKKRLDAVGFGDLTLDIHDKSSSPTEIKAQINRSLDAESKDVDEQVAQILRTLDVSESLLSKYVDKLRAPNAAGFTLYEAVLTSLEPREGVAPLRVPEEFVANTSKDDIEKLRAVMKSLVDLEGGIKLGPDSGWRFISDRLDTPQRDTLFQACEAIDQIVSLISGEPALARVLEGPRSPAQLAMAVTVLTHDSVSKESLTDALDVVWERRNTETINELQLLARSREGALALFEPSVLDGDIARVTELAAQLSHQGFFQKRRTVKEAIQILSPYVKQGIKLKARNILEYATLLSSLTGLVQEVVKSLNTRIGYEITAGLNPLTEDGRSALKDALTRFRRIGRFYADPKAGKELELQALLEVREQLRGDNTETLRALLDAFSALQRQFNLKDQDFESWSHDTGLVTRWSQTALLRRGAAGANGLASWMDLLEALVAFDEHDFGDAKQQVLNKDIRLSDLPLALENGIAAASVDERLNSLGLSEFDGQNHDVQVARFSRNLGQLRSLLTDSLPSSVLSSRPFDTSGTRGRIAQLRNQVTKKRGGLTIRALFAEFSDIIPNLLPCVMTNPDGIARLFPPRAHQFDLVIFDEASQIRVAEGIGAMGRADSVVVVGDTKQMPPTSFAQVSDDIGDVDEVESLADLEGRLGDQESLLDECKDAFSNPMQLTWHYRSQDESLIAFSNSAYYDYTLASFPTPSTTKHKEGLGIRFHRVARDNASQAFVSGLKSERGKAPLSPRVNLKEAEAIVENIKKRFEDSPEEAPSVGVVTFNQEQRGVIEKALRNTADARILEALDDDEGIFVKSIEFVQGDERDTVLFSLGREPGEDGRVALTGFGPLTQRGGHRRLNVAITRARRQVEIFSSFEPEQLPAEAATNRALKDLKKYLVWAKEGASEDDERGPIRNPVHDPHRRRIAKALTTEGLEVKQDLGMSEFRVDMSVRDPHGKEPSEVAILLDGPGWRRRLTTSDRDVLPVEILKGLMGWKHIIRVWLPEWLSNPDAVIQRIVAEVREISNGEVLPSTKGQSADEDVFTALQEIDLSDTDISPFEPNKPEKNPIKTGAAGPGTRWIAAYVRPQGSREFLDYLPREPHAVETVQAVMTEITRVEGPIAFSRLVRLTAIVFDLSKLSAKREATITSVIPPMLRKTPDEDFAWPSDIDPSTWKEFRYSIEPAERPLEIVSKREVANAMAYHCGRSLGMNRDDLFRETAATFGAKRLTQSLEARLDTALNFAVSTGTLVENKSGHFVLP